ncbi:A/G-specific adenine glycosylase [Daejeonella sp.]|uniref:A/G-specific adenine glycosylase n=1 Tax=Daejeonella sp. TaxID=2805397 RepID=UPI003983ACF9
MDFARVIIDWYSHHKRDLPWRHTSDPYVIWLSEIIMQQTRVDQGTPYFNRFAEKYPTVADFASAEEDDILKMWQGLGYYSRGRNMHYTARMVMEEYGGYFPSDYNSLLKLKGIGEYTAAAISSFSTNEARAVVDGNVFRLLARYFGIDIPINTGKGKKVFTDIANQLIDKKQAGIYNQAAMEFGSQVCKPKNPHCPLCPLRPGCTACLSSRINVLPVKIKTQKVRERYFNYIIAIKNDCILMNKRGPNDIWENLYELPLFETDNSIEVGSLTAQENFVDAFGPRVHIKSVVGPVKHILSHQRLYATFIELEEYQEQLTLPNYWKYVRIQDLERLAQPKLIFHFFKNFVKLIK